jgi:hypothetical protein
VAPLQRLDRRLLLALYAVVPLAFAVMLLDQFALSAALQRDVLPTAPEAWPAWTVVFGMPHVIAGLLTMADREYLAYYRRRFFLPFLGFGTVSVTAAIGPPPLTFAISLWLGFYTVTHLLTQQIGLTFTMLDNAQVRFMRMWKWTMLALGLLVYAGLYLDTNFSQASIAGLDPHALVILGGAALLVLLAIFTAFLGRSGMDFCAVAYIWSNFAMMAGVLAAYVWRYPVFILLIPRVIHDLTAYLVYHTHDRNRNAKEAQNVLYWGKHVQRRTAFWVLPGVSIALAYALQMDDVPLFIGINFMLTFMHYHIESVVWRRPHLHRRFLVLS